MRDVLHREIDEQEALREKARAMVRQIWASKMAGALDIAQGDGTHIGSHITEAMQYLAGEVAKGLDGLTAEALKAGGESGKARVRSVLAGDELGD